MAYAKRMKFNSLTHDAQALAYLVDRVGIDNVFVGTDLPFDMAPPRPTETLHAGVGAAAAKQIAVTNVAVAGQCGYCFSGIFTTAYTMASRQLSRPPV